MKRQKRKANQKKKLKGKALLIWLVYKLRLMG
jgi:hypothetical protein